MWRPRRRGAGRPLPRPNRLDRAARLLGAFLLGAVTGAALILPLTGKLVEEQELARQELENRVEQLANQLEQLQSSSEKPRVRRVEAVEVHFEGVSDDATRLALQKALSPFFKQFLGKEIATLDPFLLRAIFADRIVRAERRSYRIELALLVLAEELLMLFEVQEQPAGAPDLEAEG